MAEIVAAFDTFLKKGGKGFQISPADANVIYLALENEELRESLMDSDIVSVDSFLPSLALKLKGVKNVSKVPGPDIMDAILEYSNSNKKSVYFLGAKQSTLDRLMPLISKGYPTLRIAGFHDGYFSDEQQVQIAEEIAKVSPDFLLIALPTPKKERFIKKYKNSINTGVLFGVGGAFDAKAGVLKRPPQWLRSFGMEGAMRILRNPKAYGGRLLICIKFFLYALSHK